MNDDELLQLLPLKRTWLDDIVGVFLKRPNGVAEIDAVVASLLKTDRNMGAEGEATVTRTINNFCINAGDEEGKVRHPIFERIGPAQYRLLTFPNAPDLIEVQKIQFAEHAYQRLWEFFVSHAKKKPKWNELTKRQQLEAFARNLKENEQLQKLLEAYGGQPPLAV
ncbi:hypothetical protein [Franzmannia qiaohouensis]|uniref:Uncharacterized protein n=1 Tax=Franzmannia qiaohouensis TaxID=1329370 RepID=A0ABU1HEA9_9GAMM|nr:hypothetical protein [Halomonas qiaohouensis]MDR5905666.1 hypothetical protein [Halomonas qiaohouensis]